MNVNDRVRLINHVSAYLLGDFPAGTTGTVVSVIEDVAFVRLDAPVNPDNPWSDLLQVHAGDTDVALYPNTSDK